MKLSPTERSIRGDSMSFGSIVVTDPYCECGGTAMLQEPPGGPCPRCGICADCSITKVRLGEWHDTTIVDDAVRIVGGKCADCALADYVESLGLNEGVA